MNASFISGKTRCRYEIAYTPSASHLLVQLLCLVVLLCVAVEFRQVVHSTGDMRVIRGETQARLSQGLLEALLSLLVPEEGLTQAYELGLSTADSVMGKSMLCFPASQCKP